MALELISKRMRKPVGVNDMVLLEEVSEDSIVDNLKERYLKDEIYVRRRLRNTHTHSLPLSLCAYEWSIVNNEWNDDRKERNDAKRGRFSPLLFLSFLWF